jgi:opacity protein-like surface antigen
MRKILLVLAALAISAGPARAASVGLGPFGGVSIPIVQDDQGNGSVFGLRAPVQLVPLLRVEPFWSTSALGDKTVDAGGASYTRTGSDVTTFGLNAMLSLGGPVTFYPFVGIGSVKFDRTGQDESFTSYHMGLGLGLSPIPKVSVDLRAELQAAAKDGTSRKMGNITLGASYALFSMP